MMDELISRQAGIDELVRWGKIPDYSDKEKNLIGAVIGMLSSLPSAQPEVKPIEYRDCANAMLRMWMDEVITDGEYDRIMDKLNAYWRAKQ